MTRIKRNIAFGFAWLDIAGLALLWSEPQFFVYLGLSVSLTYWAAALLMSARQGDTR